jgi:hypothetical protein
VSNFIDVHRHSFNTKYREALAKYGYDDLDPAQFDSASHVCVIEFRSATASARTDSWSAVAPTTAKMKGSSAAQPISMAMPIPTAA